MIQHAVVLLSGGLDSTAALCWAIQRYTDVRAFGIDYGQANRDAELTSARRACDTLGVPYVGIAVADALRPQQPAGILGEIPAPGLACGIDRAFVPGRNALFATIAVAHACTWWPDAFDIVIGACAEDQAGFPDCRPVVLAHLAFALTNACARLVAIKTPWADMAKQQILYAVQPDEKAFDLVRRSWSCYRSEGPCGTCGACVKRAAGFAGLGIEDLCTPVKMTGGDPQREVA
jgi:7-cyano-7-deazaguanine synthase